MSANIVRKYVSELEDKQFIRTEPTTVITRDGRKRNGTLRYHIRLIREAVDHYHEQQLHQLELDVERQKAQTRLSRCVQLRSRQCQQDGPQHLQHREAACQGCVALRAKRMPSAICQTVQ